MSAEQQKSKEETADQPTTYTYRLPLALSIILWFLAAQSLCLGIISLKSSLFGVAISFSFGILCVFLAIYMLPGVVYDHQNIQTLIPLRKAESISWEEIEQVKGQPILQAIDLYANGKKFAKIIGKYEGINRFISYLRWNRRDLFESEEKLIISRNIRRTLFLIGAIAAGILISFFASSGWIIGAILTTWAVYEFLRSPYKLTLTPSGLAVFNFPFSRLELAFSDIQPPPNFSDFQFQVVYQSKGTKKKFPLTYLSNNDALLYCYLRTWWENHHNFLLIPLNYKEFGPCECCGNMSLTVWGELQEKGKVVALYYVYWTQKRPDHGAAFDLIIGDFSDDSTAEDRYAVSLLFRILEGVPQFMVIDAAGRPTAESNLVENIFSREQVINSPLQKRIFNMVDDIYVQDNRIAELRPK